MALELNVKATSGLSGTAGSLLQLKDAQAVYSIGPTESVYQAVAKMSEYRVGALFVMQGPTLLGVISERDYTRNVILHGRSSKDTRVEEIMSAPAIHVESSTPLVECMNIINERRIRHLPVMEGGKVIGGLSIGDLVRAIVHQQAGIIEQLHALVNDPYPA
ncbi:MAG TPA: CBS domain-containing protein [Burkholderiales bacterium]|nr:CBS domain-containing protein [Burkholderiales bacterium]